MTPIAELMLKKRITYSAAKAEVEAASAGRASEVAAPSGTLAVTTGSAIQTAHAALIKARDYVIDNNPAGSWWNYEPAYRLVTDVLDPAIKASSPNGRGQTTQPRASANP